MEVTNYNFLDYKFFNCSAETPLSYFHKIDLYFIMIFAPF